MAITTVPPVANTGTTRNVPQQPFGVAVRKQPDLTAVDGDPTRTVRSWLRAEAVAAIGAGVALYVWLGAPLLALIPLLILPDVSVIGYLHSPRTGALIYNLAHNWATALLVLGLGLWLPSVPVAVAGSILIAHVGVDRTLGYGLKLSTAFQDTHLGRIGGRR